MPRWARQNLVFRRHGSAEGGGCLESRSKMKSREELGRSESCGDRGSLTTALVLRFASSLLPGVAEVDGTPDGSTV